MTDKAVYKKAGTEEVADHTYTVGQLPEDYATIESTNAKRLTADRLTDRFADAYKRSTTMRPTTRSASLRRQLRRKPTPS